MRRSVLITLTALGALLSLLGAGLFAALTDTAHTGTNEVSTVQLAASSDLKLAAGTFQVSPDPTGPSGIECGTYEDDMESRYITLTDQTPGTDTGQGFFLCVKNFGSQSVDLTASPVNVGDTETGCTGDEAAYDPDGPGSCGTLLETNTGELAVAVTETWYGIDCQTGQTEQGPTGEVAIPNAARTIDAYTQAPEPFGSLAPGQARCFGTSIFMSPATPEQRQASQTDELTWKWAFTGAVPAS